MPDRLTARPGGTSGSSCARIRAEVVRLEVWHPEGWLVDGFEWPWPGAAPAPRDGGARARGRPRARPLGARITVGSRAPRSPLAAGLAGAPRPGRGHAPRPGRAARGRTAAQVVAPGPGAARAPLAGWDWQGSISARIEGRTVVFEYECTYLGSRPFNAKEVGLTLRPSSDLTDLWWRRVGEWSLYPADHIGRTAGYAAAGAGHELDAPPGPDLGAGRDRGGEQRLPEREAGDPRRRRHRRPAIPHRPVRRDAARPRRARRRRPRSSTCSTGTAACEPSTATTRSGRRTSGPAMPVATGTILRGRVVLAAGDAPCRSRDATGGRPAVEQSGRRSRAG